MSDISPLNPFKKTEKLLDPPHLNKNPSKQIIKLSEYKNSMESSDTFDPEMINQVNQDLDDLSAPLSSNNLQNAQIVLANLHKLSPKQRQLLQETIHRNLHNLEILLLGLKKNKAIDPKMVDTILCSIKHCNSKDTKKLAATLSALEQRTTELISDQQIDSKIGNILVIFLAFAKAQMDQNDKAMLAGIDQTKVKTAQLELQSQKQKDLASESNSSKHVSETKCLLIAGAIVIFGGILGILTGGVSLAIGLGVVGAAVGVGSAAGYAKNHLDNPGVVGIVGEGPDSNRVHTMQYMMSYLNTEASALSSKLGFTEKMFVENISDQSARLGQQAGEAIRDLGDVMKA